MPDSVSGMVKEDHLVVAIDFPAVTLVSAENCTKHFGSSGADQSGKAENFAILQSEGYTVDVAPKAQVLHPDCRGPA